MAAVAATAVEAAISTAAVISMAEDMAVSTDHMVTSLLGAVSGVPSGGRTGAIRTGTIRMGILTEHPI